MTIERPALLAQVIELLCAIAPEIDAGALAPAQPLRQQVDLDSMDWLNFLLSLKAQLGIEVAESDYARLVSLNDVLDYLQAHGA